MVRSGEGRSVQTAGIKIEVVETRAKAQALADNHKCAAILVFTKDFSRKVHHCSFLDDKFLEDKPGVNPFFRDGVKLDEVGLDVITDPKQVLGASIIKQVAQVSLLRVVLPWMIGKAFDKISEKQFIDEMSDRVEVTSFGKNKFKPLKVLNPAQRAEVGVGVQASLQEMFHKYDLRAKTWAAMTRQDGEPGHDTSETPCAGEVRYQILVPSYTVMFAFFLVLTVGWLFVSERRQGTMLRLRAAPLSCADSGREAVTVLCTLVGARVLPPGGRADSIRHDLGPEAVAAGARRHLHVAGGRGPVALGRQRGEDRNASVDLRLVAGADPGRRERLPTAVGPDARDDAARQPVHAARLGAGCLPDHADYREHGDGAARLRRARCSVSSSSVCRGSCCGWTRNCHSQPLRYSRA